MAKLLNLDELQQDEYELKLNGKIYPMKELSVGDFIKISKMTQDLGEDLNESDQIELMIEVIQMRFPDMPGEDLMGLSVTNLGKLVEFVQNMSKVTDEAQGEGN